MSGKSVLVRQWGTISADLQGVETPILPGSRLRAFPPIQPVCSHHVFQRLNGKSMAISKPQVLQVRRKQRSFGLRVDPGENSEVGVGETGAAYEVHLS